METFKISSENKKYSITRIIRIDENLLKRLEELANKNNISTNKLIIKCIEFALKNMEQDEGYTK